MEIADLSGDVLAAALPARPVRTYPALISTEADALAWARAGAAEGAVVVAGYQASPRGRAGLPWSLRGAKDLGFSLILRPHLPVEREGWVYTLATSGLADAVGAEATIAWPDEVRVRGERKGAVGVHVELGPEGTEWAVVNVLAVDVEAPRATALGRIVGAIESRYRSGTARVLADYLRRCETIGRSVRARLIPLGPAGPQVSGTAVSSLPDGSLVLETSAGRRVAVRPQNLGMLEEAP